MTIFVTTSNLYLSVTNIANPAHALVVVNRLIKTGETKSIPLRYITDNYYRAKELQDLVHSNNIQVTFNNAEFDFTSLGPLSEQYLGALATPSAPPMGQLLVYDALADLPVFSTVPVGFCVYCLDTDGGGTALPLYATSTHWLDAAGTIVV